MNCSNLYVYNNQQLSKFENVILEDELTIIPDEDTLLDDSFSILSSSTLQAEKLPRISKPTRSLLNLIFFILKPLSRLILLYIINFKVSTNKETVFLVSF